MKNEINWLTLRYFSKEEFTCKCGCGLNNISDFLIETLHSARTIAKTPFIINSACRCVSHNKHVKGSKTSSHLKGLAVDIEVKDSHQRYKILNALFFVGFKRIGVYENFIHVDIDSDKTKQVTWYK